MRIVLAFCIAVALFTGCKDNSVGTQLPSSHFAIDLQNDFESDLVRVQLDGKVIFNDTAKTNEVLGLARHLTPSATQGPHTIRVAMADTTIADQMFFSAVDTTTVAVTYIRQMKQFRIEVFNSIVLYE